MAGMKIIPLIAAGDDRTRDEAAILSRTLVHQLRQDLNARVDTLVAALRQDVERSCADLDRRLRALE